MSAYVPEKGDFIESLAKAKKARVRYAETLFDFGIGYII